MVVSHPSPLFHIAHVQMTRRPHGEQERYLGKEDLVVNKKDVPEKQAQQKAQHDHSRKCHVGQSVVARKLNLWPRVVVSLSFLCVDAPLTVGDHKSNLIMVQINY